MPSIYRLIDSRLLILLYAIIPITGFGQTSDSVLLESIHNNYRPWFFTTEEALRNKTKSYSNGQIFDSYAFLNDSMLITQSTFYKNGNLASQYELLSPECIQWKNTNGIVTFESSVNETYESYYENGSSRAYMLKSDHIYTYAALDRNENKVYSELTVSGDTICGFYCITWIKSGLLHKYYEKGKLIYLVETDVNYEIESIRDRQGNLLESPDLYAKFEQITRFKYDGKDW